MKKHIDMKNRVVEFTDCDTGSIEQEIVSYLDRKMFVCFYSATFSNSIYVFTGNPKDKIKNAITVSGYRKKNPGENISIDINSSY